MTKYFCYLHSQSRDLLPGKANEMAKICQLKTLVRAKGTAILFNRSRDSQDIISTSKTDIFEHYFHGQEKSYGVVNKIERVEIKKFLVHEFLHTETRESGSCS